MKIIDLLNKIANGEEVPKKIKYNDYIYTVKGNAIENFVDYCSEEDEWCFNHYVRYENLNDKVEILEEEKKIPEKLNTFEELTHIPENFNFNDILLANKLNEIIDYLDYFKSKGE